MEEARHPLHSEDGIEWLQSAVAAAPQAWEGTLIDYLALVRQRPDLAEGAHARVYRMIRSAGVTTSGTDRQWNFFSHQLFGLDATLNTLVEDYFHAAAMGLDVRKRLLLLMGPVSGGKSTLVTLLKRGLEAFTATDGGAVFAIAGCPMQEDPLHLIPHSLRSGAERQLGVKIEGELCPVCRLRLNEDFGGRFQEMRVHRVVFSEASRVGIGTFVPSDPKSQDIADLTGSLDFSTITQFGSESDPRAFRFDGELYRANRGLMEFQEMLKLDEKFLYHLLGLTQEGTFKAGRFALISADQVVVGHTNETEFRTFAQNPRNEALLSRMIVVRVPYSLAVSDETAIYQKLLGASPLAKSVHWAPGALEAAATVSVVSRVKESQRPGLEPLIKVAVLNHEAVSGLSPDDEDAVWEEARHEGMQGLDPRYVVNRLASAVIRCQAQCLTAVDVLRALRTGFGQHAWLGKGGEERIQEWVGLARRRYDERVRREVQAAFIAGFEENARALFNNYLDNVEASLAPGRRVDPISGQLLMPDEDLMRGIEEPLGIGEAQRRSFREEVWLRISAAGGRHEAWDYRVHAQLREAVETKVFMDLRDVVKISQAIGRYDPVQEAKILSLAERLMESGYCAHCARETVLYVGALLSR